MSSPGTPVRIAKYLGTVLLVAVAVVLMIFGVGAILDRLDPGEPLSQGQIDQAIQQPPTSPPVPVQEPVMTQTPDPTETPDETGSLSDRTPFVAVHQYLGNEYWYGQPEQGTSIVESLTVEDDDVIIRLRTPFEANVTKNHAPSIVADSTRTLQEHRDDPAIAGLDLLAVYSSDGVMVGSDSISGRPQAAS